MGFLCRSSGKFTGATKHLFFRTKCFKRKVSLLKPISKARFKRRTSVAPNYIDQRIKYNSTLARQWLDVWNQVVLLQWFLPLKGHLEFSGAFFLAEVFEKVSFDPYNSRITRLSARKSEPMKNFLSDKNIRCLYLALKYQYTFNNAL